MMRPRAAGLDFGTTNSVAALSNGQGGAPHLVPLSGPEGDGELYRSALCFWHDEGARGGLAVAAGPGVPDATALALAEMGRRLGSSNGGFGRYSSVERRDSASERVYSAASDVRADGLGLAY